MIKRLPIIMIILVALLSLPAHAGGNWPERPIRLVVPFAPGGATDIAARILADGLSKEFGQPVMVENISGAGGMNGIRAVAQEKADGYTLLMATQGMMTFNPHLYKDLKFDPRRDFVPVGQVFITDMILIVNPKLRANTLKEFIALANTEGEKLTYGSAGNGSGAHVLMERFKSIAKIHLRHIPYRGTAPALTDLVAGTIDAMIDSIPTAMGQIKAGSVRPIAICGIRRNPRLPDVPTFAESGLPEYKTAIWLAVFAPAKTPAEIVAKLSEAMKRSLGNVDLATRAYQAGIDVEWGSAKNLAERLQKDFDLWGDVIQNAGISIN